MKKLFLIGGMGAGKSTARKALTDEGLAWIDLDQVGHEVLMWDTVKDDLRGAFGDDIFEVTVFKPCVIGNGKIELRTL